MGDWLCSLKPGFVWVFPLLLTYLKVPVSYFRFLLIVLYGKMLEHILQMWFFFFFFLVLLEACVTLSVAAAFFPFMRFPMFLPEHYFIYASQVTLRPQNRLMINRLSLGAYLIDILWNVMPVLQKLNSFVFIYCCLQCTAWFYLIECYCLIFSSYRRDHALLYDMF